MAKKINSQNSKIRLPNTVVPEHYRISLLIDISKKFFLGRERIKIHVKRATHEIILHSVGLDLSEVVLDFKDELVPVKEIVLDDYSETVKFTFAKKIESGTHHLDITFKGHLTEKLHGLYLSHYFEKGKKKFLATTQFESTYARQAFPCFDEPALKAVFELDLQYEKGLKAISNTETIPAQSSLLPRDARYAQVFFAPTPIMSTYLLAYIVGDLQSIEGKTKRGVVVRVHARKEKKNELQFALECGIKSLDFFEKYFAIRYPLKSLNLIAIPDFSAGAMENWGAITFREVFLLSNKSSSLRTRQLVAIFTAHEVAHQWFGNLVTMHWWSDLWLNEGFANYAEYLATDALFPYWHIWDEFLHEEFSSLAQKADSLLNTHPIQVEINHPREIDQAFDKAISYAKSSAVIRMMAAYIGEKEFRDGLRVYLKKHAYKNTTPTDLWEVLSAVSGKDVGAFMDSWIRQPGYPIVRVQGDTNILRVSQERFVRVPNQKPKLTETWPIPLEILSAESKKRINAILKTRRNTFAAKKVLKLNAGSRGFYRVDYRGIYWDRIEEGLSKGIFDFPDRFNILNDAFALAYAGEISFEKYLNLLKYFKDETEYNIWSEIRSELFAISEIVDQKNYQQYSKFVNSIIDYQLAKLGFDKKKGDSLNDTLTRHSLLGLGVRFKNEKVLDHLLPLYRKLISGVPVDSDLVALLFRTAAVTGSAKEYKQLEIRFKKTSSLAEKDEIVNALGFFSQPELIEKTLQKILHSNTRGAERPQLFRGVISNELGRGAAFNYFLNNWSAIYKHYAGQGYELTRFINSLAALNTKKDADELRKLFKKNNAPGYQRVIDLAIEEILLKDSRRKDLAHSWPKEFFQNSIYEG